MAVEYHGWRTYHMVMCRRTSEYAIAGQFGMHMHENPSPKAGCRGFAQGMWHISKAEMQAHESDGAPSIHCSCGFYAYRTLRGCATAFPTLNIVAHITALGSVVVHQQGLRSQQVRIDYFLPVKEQTQVWTWGMVAPGAPLAKILGEVAEQFSVPILPPDDPLGCQSCLLASQKEKETDEQDR